MNWKEILMGSEDWHFVWEICIRTFLMIIIIILALRILGKRGVKQLSIFELVVIISFGTAAGDPMIYKEVGIISATITFIIIILVYRFIIYLIGKNKRFEIIMEGAPICLVEKGEFSINNFKKEQLGSQELVSVLRLKGVSQLGQIDYAIEEISGDISVFFLEDEKVKYGLPILPAALENIVKNFEVGNYYSCTFCGHTLVYQNDFKTICEKCNYKEWVLSSNQIRVK